MEKLFHISLGKDLYKRKQGLKMNIFTEKFLMISAQDITKQIKATGYYCFENALTEDFIYSIESAVDQNRTGFNKNWISGVYVNGQYFFTHMLAISRDFFNYVCHPKIMEIGSSFLGTTDIRLKAMRYYETFGHFQMQWHTDNKTDRVFSHIPGLIVICYLCDVRDGEFQYIEGSQKWSGKRAYSDYCDEEIQEKYSQKIVSFKKPRGTILIYDTYGIHRAKPVLNGNYVRKSLFFQIDSEVGNGEPILLNPSYCMNLTKQLNRYLGFGLPAKYKVFPESKLEYHPLNFSVGVTLIRWTLYRMVRGVYEIIPSALKNKIKNYIKAKKNPN
jgi:ectoine hydroxylase-related dioxygenase (phytanoyl-CoA dioxygenase family)